VVPEAEWQGAMAGIGTGATADAIVGAIAKDENGYYKPCGIVGAVDKIAKNKDVIDEMYRIFYFQNKI
jgi:ribose 5-phosphate isomerase